MSKPYELVIPTDLPTEQFLTLGRAIVPGGDGPDLLSWETHDAAIVVELYLTGQLRTDLTNPEGTLKLSESLTDEAAAAHFTRLGGEGPQAALDPTLKAALLAYLVNTLLPKLLGRFGL